MPHVVAQPAQFLRVLRRGLVELLAAVGDVVVVLGQVGVQAHALALEAAREFGALAHQVGAHRKRRTRRERDLHHGASRGVVPGFDQALAVFQDRVFLLNHAVGWQPALRLPHAHAAARGQEAHADLLCRFDAVFELHAIGVDVEVVAAGGAAAEQEFGHRHLGRDLHHLGREPGPDRVEPAQPAEELGVLHTGYGPCEALVHVVVRVHEAGRDKVTTGVDGLTGRFQQRAWQLGGRTDPFDHVVAHEQRCVFQLAAL
ncbi:hypothetical protein Y695_02982 [Hydrogenophaga sp. T4]|nr:hypothetical protein Y695_02982 [Hydrogenophaga sp. T4]